MYAKIEPSGVCERKGMVQIRLCFYLESTDYGYEKHYVQVPVIPKEGYTGKIGEMGVPVDLKHYEGWIDSLPKIWQNNPFLNHFIYVNPDTTDKEILDIAEAFLHEAYIKWATDTKLDLANDSLPFTKPVIVTSERRVACESRVQSVKAIKMEREV